MNYSTGPKVYIQCLGCYNAGKIFGKWTPASLATEAWEDLQDYYTAQQLKNLSIGIEVDQYHACDNPEEYMIADYEGFAGLSISEYEALETIEILAEAIEEHGEAFTAYLESIGGIRYLEQAVESFEESYCGIYYSEQEYAEELFDELYAHDLPMNLRHYIDYDKFARDLFLSDMFSVKLDTDEFAIFRNI